MPKEQTDLAVRKKMRKGTHSCFECRRRKIKCIFQPDSPDVCSECFARGSRCVDQEHANPDIVVDHRKNLRERVSRLEALVDSLLEDKSERRSSQTETSSSRTPRLVTRDAFPPTPHSSETSSAILPEPQLKPQRAASDRGHHIPIISVFEDSLNDKMKGRVDHVTPLSKEEPNTAAEERYTITCKNPEDIMDEGSARFKAKRDRAKQGLLAILPPYDQLQRILNSNTGWWQTWRRKCSGTSDPNETLADFAAKALTNGNIGAVGLVALAVGISSDDEVEAEKYIEAVDRYVMFDDEYAATLEGMECLILKAKWYADVGQPRRAWISQRKGLLYAQLMGLHRQRTTSTPHESIWWSLYHGDRFLSLLLGLPYAIQDSHCDLTLPDTGNGQYLAPLLFMNKVAILSGKVIDRNQSVAEQSFAWALQVDQELEDLWKRLDPAWLEYSELMADIENNAAELRERLMAQIVYHQIRVYLHLPFMLKSQSNPRFSFSRNACVNGSREVLRLYQALRTGEVQPLYECKAVDFVGFTAAVLIMLGLYNFGGRSGGMEAKEQEEDTRLIEISIDIFRRASSEKGGKVALQSAQVLENMLGKFKADWGNEGGTPGQCDGASDFVIPYFGKISVRRGGQRGPAAPSPAGAAGAAAAPSRTSQQPSNNKRQGSTVFPSRTQSTPLTTSPTLITPSDTTSSDFLTTPTLSSISAGSTSTPASSTNPNALFPSTDPFPSISYDGFYNFANLADPSSTSSSTLPNTSSSTNDPALSTQINDDSMNNFPLPTNNFSWQNMPMDIDQDWSWFLNDGVTTGGGLQGGGASGSGGGGNGGGSGSGSGGQGVWGGIGGDFSMQTYAGF